MKKLLPLLLLPLALGCPAKSTTGNDGGTNPDGGSSKPADGFTWAKGFSSPAGATITAMATDSSGVYVVGQIEGTTTFGSTTLTADSSGRAFIAKLNGDGDVLWAQAASGTESGFEAVTLDGDHNVYLTAYSDGNSAEFTFGGATLSGQGAVLASVDQDGTYRFSHLFTSTTEIDISTVAVSGDNVIISGPLDGEGDFMGSTVNCGVNSCVYLAAYARAGGAYVWAKAAASTPPRGNGVRNGHEIWLAPASTSNGNVAMAIGGYWETTLSGYSGNELVLNEYDGSGNLLWNKVYITTDPSQGPLTNGFGVDASGNLYVAADFGNTLVLGSTTVGSDARAGDGSFVAQFDGSNGNVKWVSQSTDAATFLPKGLGVSGTTVVSFGNGDDVLGVLPDDRVPMDAVSFSSSSGAQARTVAGVASGTGQAVTTGALGTFVAGISDSNGDGTFGLLSTTNSGIFVAKLK